MPRATAAEADHSVAPRATAWAVASRGVSVASKATTYNADVAAFRPLASLLDLDALIRSSHDAPVIVFKHSETCGTSWLARERLSHGDLEGPVHEIVVQRQRGLSDAVAARLGVRHESPQALVIAAGTAVWHTSHAGVTAERVAHAWTAAIPAPRTPAAAR
jgi:bacillithiol system protein YtxJ